LDLVPTVGFPFPVTNDILDILVGLYIWQTRFDCCFFFRWFYMSFEQMAFDIASFLDTAPTSWFAVVNRFLVIYSAYTHDKFILICPLNDQWYCIPFAQKRFGKTSFCALYLVKNSAPVHAFYISFLSLKRYYSIIFFIKACAWSHGIEQRNVSIVVCAGESRLSHARTECVNLYQSISKGCIPISQEMD
jgi:hypothetical protein